MDASDLSVYYRDFARVSIVVTFTCVEMANCA